MSSDRTRGEFTRQASTMAAAAVFNAQELLDAIVEASGHGPGRRTLDIGCGPGIVAEALARRGGAVIGLDLTPQMLRQASARCRQAGLDNTAFVLGPAEQLPFPPGHFHAAVSRFALHHVTDPAAVVAEMARVVKPGGRIVLADAVSSEDAEQALLHNALETIRDPSHVRMLPASQLLELVSGRGLKLLGRRDWAQPRQFEEWMRIVNAPERDRPLRIVMESLARAGVSAGIDLQCRGGVVCFTHCLAMLTLERVDHPAEGHPS